MRFRKFRNILLRKRYRLLQPLQDFREKDVSHKREVLHEELNLGQSRDEGQASMAAAKSEATNKNILIPANFSLYEIKFCNTAAERCNINGQIHALRS